MSTTSDRRGWSIERIVANDEGCRFYLDQYKPFRLTSLKQDPDAFGSTYEREINFTDADWLGRIKNPVAKTFVAVRPHDGRVLSATSLIGPLPSADPASNPFQVSTEMRHGADHPRCGEASAAASFQLTGVYTIPDARGRGIAKALVKAVIEQAVQETSQQGKELALSVVVYSSNHAAITFYESCGFVADAEGPRACFNPIKKSSASELCMRHYRASG
ncbi:hypothetical protein GGR52DRAFT_464958 [Hypoxylon sp. FL1284]|nr:hypothetical protein GGR52DRAFT_257750 [Hypoxylon sp. FL1284]KAI0172327.1 hypothetical protein GGR52DRAFT_464958 [Hypoxylon sp. FL1284]